jgi:hypothetical protein
MASTASSISPTAVTVIVDLYCQCWNEASPDRRRDLLTKVWSADATYTDPTVHLVGVDQLSQHIEKVLEQAPGSLIVRTSAVDFHHSVFRFNWHKELSSGEALPEGTDFGEVGEGGVLTRIVGFFDPPKPPRL